MVACPLTPQDRALGCARRIMQIRKFKRVNLDQIECVLIAVHNLVHDLAWLEGRPDQYFLFICSLENLALQRCVNELPSIQF